MSTQRPSLAAVMFDLDGTLLDTAPDFILIVNQLLQQEGRAALPDDIIRAGVSNGSNALIRLAFGINETDPAFEVLRQRLLALYLDNIAVGTQLFPGMQTLLTQLAEHNIPWGIATNKPFIYTEPLMRELDIRPAPATIICPEHVVRSKPDPASMYLAAEQLGCTPAQILFIGDHKRDIDCGRAAGSLTMAAAYGYIDASDDPQQWQADHLVNHADEIWPIVQQYR